MNRAVGLYSMLQFYCNIYSCHLNFILYKSLILKILTLRISRIINDAKQINAVEVKIYYSLEVSY